MNGTVRTSTGTCPTRGDLSTRLDALTDDTINLGLLVECRDEIKRQRNLLIDAEELLLHYAPSTPCVRKWRRLVSGAE